MLVLWISLRSISRLVFRVSKLETNPLLLGEGALFPLLGGERELL
jgi:hypothetical protein